MERGVDGLVAAASERLEAGDWGAARDAFAAALDVEETPEALFGLSEAVWWLGDLPEAIALRERAYAAYCHLPDPAQAALIALRLAFDNFAHVGNAAAAAGWLARAARLIEEHDLEPLRGWQALFTSYLGEDPVLAEKHAEEARDLGRRAGDFDLELCALSQAGSSLVEQGRVAEGVARLDEALAGSLGGEGSSLDTVVFTSCNMITSCSQCADFERAVQWIRAADRFAQRYGCPFLYVECRTFYGWVLVATGDWERAETELRTALERSRDSVPVLHHKALAALAELRLAQGRVEEAERLVSGSDGHESAAVRARLQLRRGRAAAAAATARRALGEAGGNRLERAVLLELLGEAEVVGGQETVAADRGRDLVEEAEAVGCEVMRARGERLLGRALAAGAGDGAREPLEAALSAFARLGMPHEAARTRLLLAESARRTEPEVAEEEARAALAALEELGAGADADAAAALLRDLGVRAARAGPKRLGALTKRETEVLGLLGEGLSNPDIAARLHLSRKTVEHHVASVLSKLGLRTRAQAAAEATRHLDPAN